MKKLNEFHKICYTRDKDYRQSRKLASVLGFKHKPRWRKTSNLSRAEMQKLYGLMGPECFDALPTGRILIHEATN